MTAEHLELLKAYIGEPNCNTQVLFYDTMEKRKIELSIFMCENRDVWIAGDESQFMELDELELIDEAVLNKPKQKIQYLAAFGVAGNTISSQVILPIEVEPADTAIASMSILMAEICKEYKEYFGTSISIENIHFNALTRIN